MALDQSALLELLEALKTTDVDERVRTATEHLYQALIDAELTAVISAAPHERTEPRTGSARAAGTNPDITGSVAPGAGCPPSATRWSMDAADHW